MNLLRCSRLLNIELKFRWLARFFETNLICALSSLLGVRDERCGHERFSVALSIASSKLSFPSDMMALEQVWLDAYLLGI